jgi:transposase
MPRRQAADGGRGRIDWTYVLRLDLTDRGFGASVLSGVRARPLAAVAGQRLLDALLTWCRERQLLKASGRQRTDSTQVLAAVRVLDRLEVVGETLHHALNTFAVAAPAWLRDVAARPTLRRVWLQRYHVVDRCVRRRSAEAIPPASIFISSPYDGNVHYATKRPTHWVGCKVHVTKTYEAEAPDPIPRVETTAAPGAGGEVTAHILTAVALIVVRPGGWLTDQPRAGT